jgi:hypothetical protein
MHLTIVLCLLLTADLAWGYVCLKKNILLFSPLNDIGLTAWTKTYGGHQLEYTAWFFVLLILLALFCVNTFVCTTDRVLRLVRLRSHYKTKRFFFRFAPHVMHYALIIILSGYLGSYMFAHVLDTRTLIPGASMTLPGTESKILLKSFDPKYYQGTRLAAFHKHVLKPKARLLLIDGEHRQTAILQYNRPVRFKGYGIFLKDFSPKKQGGMGMKTRIDLSIRKDPGVFLYLIGMLIFTAGMVGYLADWIFLRRPIKDATAKNNFAAAEVRDHRSSKTKSYKNLS